MRWPRGITSAAAASGIKGSKGALDFALLVARSPAAWAGTFTNNAAAAPCVRWSRERLGAPVRAVAVNSGNANCCTGAAGGKAVEQTGSVVADELGCSAQEVLIASTGPIGVTLPVELMLDAVPGLVRAQAANPKRFAHAILTTDTVVKTSVASLGGASMVGVAKGAAMLQPNMATMLAFVTTDARVPEALLQPVFGEVVARTFNRICVDACESTNDSSFLLSTGLGATVEPDTFGRALAEVCADLARQMVRDAEGATRFVRIKIGGAGDDEAAARLGRAVAGSALWRAAAYGGDPNWGRIASALGSEDHRLDLSLLELDIGGEMVFSHGEPLGSAEAAARVMGQAELTVECRVGSGRGSAEILSCDLSPDYVSLNAGGTT